MLPSPDDKSTPKKEARMNTQAHALTGDALLQFLDRLEADLEEEGGSGQAVALAERLAAQPLRADSLEAIERLVALWMQAGNAAAARAVIEADGAALLQTLPPQEHAWTQTCLLRFQLEIAEQRDEAEAMLKTLAAFLALLDVPGFEVEEIEKYDHIFERLCDSPHRDVALAATRFCHAVAQKTPERAAYRAWDEASSHGRAARTHARHKEAEPARSAADKAIAALKAAAGNQDVDADDWLRLGDNLIEIAPDRFPVFQQAVTALIQDMVLPQRREVEVRLARLQARALHAQGDLHGALQACETARYRFETMDFEYGFIEHEIPWLMQAGRVDEAGRRAFLHAHILLERTAIWEGVLRLVHERLADPADALVWWPLCVMCACRQPHNLRALCQLAPAGIPLAVSKTHQALFGKSFALKDDADADRIFSAARALAEARAPGHPWIRVLAATWDLQKGRINAATAETELTEAIAEGQMGDHRTAQDHFAARVAAFGLEWALHFPPPQMESGLSAYNFACMISEEYGAQINRLPQAEQQAYLGINELMSTVFEQGLAHMERYFETGKGHLHDAGAHRYSMLCCNLANMYAVERPQEAIDLHQRGIAVSPFAEHYQGILDACKRLKDDAKIVEAAENLWQFALENGYSRHDPSNYATYVGDALHRLDRDREIPIWLERLVTFQREAGLDEAHLPTNALDARLMLAYHLHYAYPDQSLTLWRAIQPQVDTEYANSAWHQSWAGDLLWAHNLRAEAVEYYERGLAVKHQEQDAQRVAEYRAQQAKRWWQVWK
jgi:hypothetical protein